MLKYKEYPKLRWPIDIRLEEIEKEQVLLITCPKGITGTPLALVAAVAPVVTCFDGSASVDEITSKFTEYGLKKETVIELVNLLDKNLFLDGPEFDKAEKKSVEDFKQLAIRPAALAGRSYSADMAGLQDQLDKHLLHSYQQSATKKGPLLGLIAPHIDYHRGGSSYGIAYNYMREHESDLYILIGTSHQYSRNLFHLTAKDFDSPLGVLPSDSDFIKKLAELYGDKRSFADEALHKNEHSLELQIPFLKHVKTKPTIVPILVGSFHHMLHSGKQPAEFAEYDEFADSLASCLKQATAAGRKVCFIAGVDMAHVGKSFGDKNFLTHTQMEEVEKRDRAYLEAIKQQDKYSLFAHIAEDADARRICGYPTLYTMIDVFDRLKLKYKAEVLDYKQAVNFNTQCAVTFASLGLHQQQ